MQILATQTFKTTDEYTGDVTRFLKIDVRFDRKDEKEFPNCDAGKVYNIILDRDSAGDEGLLSYKKKSKYYKGMINAIYEKKRFGKLLDLLTKKGYDYEWGISDSDDVDDTWDGNLLPVGQSYNQRSNHSYDEYDS